MSRQKRPKEDVAQYIESLMIPPERVEASYIWAGDPLTFAVVSTHRFIGTKIAQSTDPIIVSVPFHAITAVTVPENGKELGLDTGQAPFLSVRGHFGDPISLNGNVNPAAAFEVYRLTSPENLRLLAEYFRGHRELRVQVCRARFSNFSRSDERLPRRELRVRKCPV